MFRVRVGLLKQSAATRAILKRKLEKPIEIEQTLNSQQIFEACRMKLKAPFGMRRVAISLMLVLLNSGALPGALAASIEEPTAASVAAEGKPGQVQEFTLANGLKVLLMEDHSFPVFSSMVFYRVGSRNENLGETGLSHLMEHLLFQRVGKLRKGELGALIARNGGMFNGFTSDDFTVFFETMAPSKLELALRLESIRMQSATFTEDDLNAEIKRIEKELELEAKDQVNLLVKEVKSAAFTRHPYKNPTIGWNTDVPKLTLDDVKRHYREYYQPGNATLVLVGDFQSRKAIELVRKYFEPLPKGQLPPAVRVVEPPQRAEKRIYMKYGGASDVVSLAYHVPGFNDADTAALAVLEKILLSGVGGRLKSRLVEPHTCSAVKSAFEVKHDPSLFTVNMTCAAGVGATRALESFDGAMEQLKGGLVTDAELQRAKNHAELQLLAERDGPYRTAFHLGFFDSLDGWQSAYSWLTRLRSVSCQDVQRVAKRYFGSENRVVGILAGSAPKSAKPPVKKEEKESKTEEPSKKKEDSKKTDPKKGENSSASKSDSKKGSAAKTESKSKDKDKGKEKGKPGRGEKSTRDRKHTAAIFGGDHQNAGCSMTSLAGLVAYKGNDETLPDARRLAQTGAGGDTKSGAGATAGSVTGGTNVKKATLKNGLTVVVLETKVSPVVQVSGAVNAGEAYEPVGKRGVSTLLARLFNSGSARLSQGQSITQQDELGLTPALMVKFDSGPQWISFQSRCLSRDTSSILQLIAGALCEPNFKDAEFEQIRKDVVDRVKSHEDTVRMRVDRALLQGLIAPNTSFYPLEPMDKSRFIANLKLADAREFHKQAVRPDAATIVFVGDIGLEQAVSLTQSAFSIWSGKSTAKKVAVQHSPRRLLKNSIIVEKKQDAMVTLGKLVDTGLGAADYPLLLLSDCALTSHPIFSRFAQKLSGETGLMSSLSLEDLASDVESMPGTTLWTLDIPVVNNMMPGMVKSIQNELKKFSRQGLSESEYAEVRLYMNGALPVRWMANSHLAARSILESVVLCGQSDPLPELYAGIKGSSTESLNKFVRERFKPDRASLVIAGTKQVVGQVHGIRHDEPSGERSGDKLEKSTEAK